jgi:drug/metabolite transporter (DMT)-like permease
MPLPPTPGFTPRRQQRVDRRRILFSSVLAAVAGTVLMVLVHRAAHTPGQPIKPIPLLGAVLLVAGAASCGAWGETMRQFALTQLGEPDGPEEI